MAVSFVNVGFKRVSRAVNTVGRSVLWESGRVTQPLCCHANKPPRAHPLLLSWPAWMQWTINAFVWIGVCVGLGWVFQRRKYRKKCGNCSLLIPACEKYDPYLKCRRAEPYNILFPKCVVADNFPSMPLTIWFLVKRWLSFRVFLELQAK